MNCPKCAVGMVGYVDNSWRCPKCNWYGKMRKDNDNWRRGLKEFLDGESLEMVLDRGHVLDMISLTCAYNDDNIPSQEILRKYWEDYIVHRFGKTRFGTISDGKNLYKGQISLDNDLPHGYGKLELSDGSEYIGWFVDGKWEGYGIHQEGYKVIESGIWSKGELLQKRVPEYSAINVVRQKVTKMMETVQ